MYQTDGYILFTILAISFGTVRQDTSTTPSGPSVTLVDMNETLSCLQLDYLASIRPKHTYYNDELGALHFQTNLKFRTVVPFNHSNIRVHIDGGAFNTRGIYSDKVKLDITLCEFLQYDLVKDSEGQVVRDCSQPMGVYTLEYDTHASTVVRALQPDENMLYINVTVAAEDLRILCFQAYARLEHRNKLMLRISDSDRVIGRLLTFATNILMSMRRNVPE